MTAATPVGRPTDLEAVKADLAAITPWPWRWAGHVSGPIYLRPPSARYAVPMAFQRLGMQGAQPVFPVDGLLVPAARLAVLEVDYRDDLIDLDHPNARFIAHAPERIAALLAEVERLRAALHVLGIDTRQAGDAA